MENTSTTLKRKTVKRERIARRVIDNILNYSKSLVVVPTPMEKTFLIVNN